MRTITRAGFVLVATATMFAADRYPASTGGDIVITPGLHSSVQVEYRDTVVQIDPWSAADLSGQKKANVILVTDDPVHHMDPKAIAALRQQGTAVVVPP